MTENLRFGDRSHSLGTETPGKSETAKDAADFLTGEAVPIEPSIETTVSGTMALGAFGLTRAFAAERYL
jgi:hypothetical protein